jgi:hypothetical protein
MIDRFSRLIVSLGRETQKRIIVLAAAATLSYIHRIGLKPLTEFCGFANCMHPMRIQMNPRCNSVAARADGFLKR